MASVHPMVPKKVTFVSVGDTGKPYGHIFPVEAKILYSQNSCNSCYYNQY